MIIGVGTGRARVACFDPADPADTGHIFAERLQGVTQIHLSLSDEAEVAMLVLEG